MRLFFYNCFSLQTVLFNFFDILQQIACLKIPNGPPFSFSALCDFIFFSKGSPLNFFDILQQIGCLKIPKGPPFSFLACETFFENLFFLQRVPFNCDKNVDNFGSVPLLSRQGLALAGPGASLGPLFCLCDFRVL